MTDNQEKFKLLNRLLLEEYVIVQINTSAKDLLLPASLLKDPSVSLKLSKMFVGPIVITEKQIEANLSFNRVYFDCKIPLEAVWSATSFQNEFTLWPESAPLRYLQNILNQQLKPKEEATSPAPQKKAKPGRPVLKRIK